LLVARQLEARTLRGDALLSDSLLASKPPFVRQGRLLSRVWDLPLQSVSIPLRLLAHVRAAGYQSKGWRHLNTRGVRPWEPSTLSDIRNYRLPTDLVGCLPSVSARSFPIPSRPNRRSRRRWKWDFATSIVRNAIAMNRRSATRCRGCLGRGKFDGRTCLSPRSSGTII